MTLAGIPVLDHRFQKVAIIVASHARDDGASHGLEDDLAQLVLSMLVEQSEIPFQNVPRQIESTRI